MLQTTESPREPGWSRRDFVKVGGAASLAVLAGGLASRAAETTPNVAGSDTIRVGLVGCGGRGTGALLDCFSSADGIEIVALGDLFEDRVKGCFESLKRKVPAEKMKVTPDALFWGFDNYKGVLSTRCNYVILATPPGFRPVHFQAAIEAGKNVFMEKPVAVDPVGVRTVIAASELAAQKKLGVVAGTQRRHQLIYVETMKRVADGAIGELVGGQCYWNQGGLWVVDQREGMSGMEWQCRNWLYFTWLSGDHIVEQHVHNLDVMNWAFGGPPVKALGLGGREVRKEPKFGNIFDHFTIEYEYANGARIVSMCRQINGCAHRIGERLVGSNGVCDPGGGRIVGANAWRYEGEHPNPYVQEHKDLIESIRRGEPLNEGKRIAESTMAAILGRMSAYTGKEIGWDWAMKKSQLNLMPPTLELGDLPVAPVAVPGQTELV